MNEKVKKTCKICGEVFLRGEKKLSAGSLGKVHLDCYKNKLIDDFGDSIGLLKFEEKIKKEKEKENLKIEREKNKIYKEKENKENKNQLIEWLVINYNVSLTKLFFIKLTNINNGTYKGLKEGISYEDLLYMFKKKKNELDKIANQKKIKGQEFENNYNRLCFDLAVIVNKYDSYKKWKQKQEINKIGEINNISKEEKNAIIHMGNIQNSNKDNGDNSDLSDILEDLY